MAKAVGIDLGTTNSVIAAVEGGQPTVIPNAEGSRTTPSVVAFTDQGERLVGQLARRQAILNPKGTIYSAKRFIGRRFDEVDERDSTAVTFDVVPGPTAWRGSTSAASCTRPRRSPRWSCASSPTTPAKFLGEKVTEAVITVPAYFNDAQRQATKDAGQDRRPRGAAHHQRADRGRAGLRAGQEAQRDRAGVRPRRRHVRRQHPRRRRRRGRGARHRGRHPPRRRRLRPPARRPPGRRVPAGQRHRPAQGPAGAAAAVRGGREGQGRAVVGDPDPGQPAVHHRRRQRAQAPHDDDHALDVRASSPPTWSSAAWARSSRRWPTPRSPPTTSTR